MVKVFPASIGGPKYLKDILAPLPQVKLIPTGGVSTDNIKDFIQAGASAVALGTALVDDRIVRVEDWETLTTRARMLRELVKAARGT